MATGISNDAPLSLADGEGALRQRIRHFLAVEATAYFLSAGHFQKWEESWTVESAGGLLKWMRGFRLPPAPPVLGLRVPTGLGKSHEVLKRLISFIEETGTPVYYFVPTHELAEELSEKAVREGLSAGVLRGHKRPDPIDPGETMCPRAKAIEPLLRSGFRLADICENEAGKCPYNGCAYRMQFEALPDVIFLPAQYLFRPPTDLPDPQLVVIDESYWQAGLQGFDKFQPTRFTTATLLESPDGEKLLQFLEQRSGGLFTRRSLYKAGVGSKACKRAIQAERDSLDDIDIPPDITESDAKTLAKELDPQGSYRLIQLWTLVERFLEDHKVPPPRLEIRRKETVPDGEGITDFLYLFWSERVSPFWTESAPTLILDATLPERLVMLDYPKLEVVDLAVEMPSPQVRIRQIRDKALSARMMLPSHTAGERKKKERRENVKPLRNYLFVEANRFRDRTVAIAGKGISILIICQQGLEKELTSLGLPDNVTTAHFNAIKGLNAFSEVPKMVIAGRTLPPPAEVERMASVMASRDVFTVGGPWYPEGPKPIQTRGNVVHLVAMESHPDPLAEEFRWQICEAELMQAIGRARGIRRTADDPLEIDILTNVPLPIPVDEVTTWEEIIPDRFDVILAETGVLPLAKGELHRLNPEHFKNKDAARYALREAGGADAIVDRLWGAKRL
jgi:putative DNA primase/helicase